MATLDRQRSFDMDVGGHQKARAMSMRAPSTRRDHRAGLAGSTNAIVHLIAIARRAASPSTSTLRPACAAHAGAGQTCGLRQVPDGGLLLRRGLRALLPRLTDLLDTAAPTVNRRTLGENVRVRGVQRRGDPPPRRAPGPSDGWRCCAATSRRTVAVIKPAAMDRGC